MNKFFITADIHFEILEMDKISNYISYFLEAIETYKPEMFCIAGDLIDDRNIKVESQAFNLLIKFVEAIANKCDELNIPFILLKGTMSHDGDVVKTVREIAAPKAIYIDEISYKLIKDRKFLFIPEPYYPTYKEFYDNWMSKQGVDKPDIIIFHGMIDFAIPQLKHIDSKYGLSRSVVIKSSDINNNCNILAIGGHVHSYIYDGKIYYTQRFINERGHYNDLDNYGIKMVTLNNTDYKVTNISNPYIIKQEVADINLIGKSDLDIEPLINLYKDRNQDDIVYKITYNFDNLDERNIMRRLTREIGAKYIKQVKIKNKNKEEVKSKIELNNNVIEDTQSLLVTTYQQMYNENLDNKYITKLKGDENE